MQITVIRKKTGEIFEAETSDRIGFNRMLGYNLITKDDFRSGHIKMMADEEDYEILVRAQKLSSYEQVAAKAQQRNLATQKQLDYLRALGVRIENRMTKSRASELIDAAKAGDLGSVAGFYVDGSN